MTSLLGAITATALLASPAAAVSSAESTADSAAGVIRESDVKTLPHFIAMADFGLLECPDEAPYLDDQTYPGGLPAGIEVRTFGGDGVSVGLIIHRDPVTHLADGVLSALASNFAIPSAERKVQLVVHCKA